MNKKPLFPSTIQSPIGAFLFLFLGFCLLVCAGCKHKQAPPPPPPPVPTPVIAQGSLAFVQRGHLARLDIETSNITPLTGGKSIEWFPALSPDGSQVVYWSDSEGGHFNIWKILADGSQRTQMTFDEDITLRTGDQNLQVNTAPAWSFDGKRIFYTINGTLWMMDSDGYNPETLLLDHNALCPAPSPDGKSVLFVSNADDTVYNLWSLTLSDKSLKKLTQYTDWNVGSPSYSQDGRKILFNLYRSNISQVYTVNSDGSDPVNLTTNNHSLCPRFAQLDSKIVYCGWEGSEDEGLNLYIMKANGTDSKILTTEGGCSPSWGPVRIISAPLPTPVAASNSLLNPSKPKTTTTPLASDISLPPASKASKK